MITIVYEINGERIQVTGDATTIWQSVEHRKALYPKTFKMIEEK